MNFYVFRSGRSYCPGNKTLLVMKLTLVLMISAFLQVSATTYGQKITLSEKNVPLEAVFRIIQSQSNYNFLYTAQMLDGAAPVSIRVRNASIEKVLDQVLKDRGLTYNIRKNIVVLKKKPMAGIAPIAVADTLRGKVTDTAGAPLPGVSVIVKDTQMGTSTDLDGNFVLNNVPPGSTLVFSYIGFLSQEMQASGGRALNITLRPDMANLEEVVVVGYGTQKKVSLTGAVGVIRSEELGNLSIASAEEALQGQVPGLKVVRTGGQPGNQSIDFQIRGTSTFTDNPVLVIVDGVPSSLDRINPNDIESISVLKDAASAAIYGSRATGGVILVTTKTGKAGRPRLSYNGTFSMQAPTRFPEKVSAYDHAVLFNEALENDNPGATPAFTQEDLDRFSSPDWHDHDWDGYMLSDAFQTNQNLSISGGSELQDYYFSFGYLNQDGTVINTGYERFNLRLNQNIRPMENLELGFKGSYAPSIRTAPAADLLGNMLAFVAAQPKTDAIKGPDGQWLQTTTGVGGGNPIALASQDGGEQILKSNQLSGNFSVKYDVLKGLDITGTYGILRNQSRRSDYRRKVTLYQQEDPAAIASQSDFNYLDVRNYETVLQNISLMVNYGETIGEHSFSILGGATREWYEESNEYVGTRDFLTDDIYAISAGSSDPSFWNISGTLSDWALASFISRANYSYRDRYLLQASMRYDGSSRFTEDLRWGFFPSVSAGWVVSEESFLEDNSFLNFLKLRASWGQVGNQNVGFYPFANTLSQSSYYFNGAPARGVTTGGAPNPLLTWETKEAMNVGIDVSAFNNRLDLSFDLFKEKTSDILLLLPVPTTFGQSAPVQNAGRVDNKGWELSLTHRNTVGKLRYGLTFQISDATETVVDMGGISPRISGNTITEEGHPVNEWFGWRAVGLFQTAEEVENHSFQNPQTSPGDIKFEENGGDPNTITSDDRVRLGRSDPRFPFGIRINLNYRNFYLMAFGQGVMRHLVWSNSWTAFNFDRANSTLRTYHLDRWTPDNPDARFPKTRIGGGASGGINNDFSSFWLEDAAYFRMKHLELGFNLPAAVASKIKMSAASIFVSAENLFTITNYLGYDPEMPTGVSGRLVERRYPLSKLYSLGVNLNF